MLGEELKFHDYCVLSLLELQGHPDFNMDVYLKVVKISGMTTAQVESLITIRGEE